MEDKEYEFSEEELMNVQGGFQHMLGNEHPFNDEKIYGENQLEKLKELKNNLKNKKQKKLEEVEDKIKLLAFASFFFLLMI